MDLNKTTWDILNKSEAVDPELIDNFLSNTAVDQPAYGILILLYSILIVLGALGNTLVIVSVVRQPAMRTPRNIFILNLAISDLLLCTVTKPLTLMEVLTKYFPLGNYNIICKLIGMLQALSVYVSTITITAIALDRYQVIVYPTRESLQLFGAACILLVIWIIAIILSSPLFIFKELDHYEMDIDGKQLHINYCYEHWPEYINRYHYSIFSFIFQYSLPIILVSAAYTSILYKLRYRFAAGFVAQDDASQSARRQHRGRRLQRTNMLLISIAVIFFLSWLPLNLYNLLADIFMGEGSNFTSNMRVVYAICHMMGMSSACSNPILYGWLNENFWKEFQEIMCLAKPSNSRTGSKRSSIRKSTNKMLNDKPDLVADFNQGTSMNTEMSQLSKC